MFELKSVIFIEFCIENSWSQVFPGHLYQERPLSSVLKQITDFTTPSPPVQGSGRVFVRTGGCSQNRRIKKN